jgi:hypothetical protein
VTVDDIVKPAFWNTNAGNDVTRHFPASGYSISGSVYYVGAVSYFWSSSLDGSYAMGMGFYDGGASSGSNYGRYQGFSVRLFASGDKEVLNLSGTVTISPTADVFVGDELTATYSGDETVTWQWNRDGTAISGATNATYTPTEEGSYTVTANAAGYNSKTSAAVEVTLDPRSPYFATWVFDNGTAVTFSADEVHSVWYDGSWYKATPLTWTAVTNTNPGIKEYYPTGYKIEGIVTESGHHLFPVGRHFGDDWAYFLHKDGNSMIEQADDNSWCNDPMTKKGSKTKLTGKRLSGGLDKVTTGGAGRRK